MKTTLAVAVGMHLLVLVIVAGSRFHVARHPVSRGTLSVSN
ncbi:hypothetical protein [Microvirga rosea]|nr:hypothetical protein [Microvirga rosea]